MKRIFLAITLILWASTAGAMSPGFWAAVTSGGDAPITYIVDLTFTGDCLYFNDISGMACTSDGGYIKLTNTLGYGYIRNYDAFFTVGNTYNYSIGIEARDITDGTFRIGPQNVATTTTPTTPSVVTGTFIANSANLILQINSTTINQSVTISSLRVW